MLVGYYFFTFNYTNLFDWKIEIQKTIEKLESKCSRNIQESSELSYFLVVKHIITATERFPTCFASKKNPFGCLVEVSAFVHSVLGNEFAIGSNNLVFSMEFYKEVEEFLSSDETIAKYILKKLKKRLSHLMHMYLLGSKILKQKNLVTEISRMEKYDESEEIQEKIALVDFKAFLDELESFQSNLKFNNGRFFFKSGQDAEEVNLKAVRFFNDYNKVNIIKALKNKCRIN